MPKFNIDGKDYEFKGGELLLKYTFGTDVEIPYFCYHPAMSVPTNCRMCLVEVGWHRKDRATGQWVFDDKGNPVVDWGRKPATACNTAIGEGMYVKTKKTSNVVKVAQEGVLEYMLVNHPLDCPICDQAGECPLQIWTYKYGPEGSRFENNKVHKPKRINLGPNVILDAERCINCTRCTRFTEEISKTNQLTIIGRGDKNHPATAPGKTFDDAYSMNVIDLCPVGALTSKSSRFQARPWEMNQTPTICTECSQGCNVNVWVRDNAVVRQTPRENEAVNQFWMCDSGRLSTDKFLKNRISGFKIKGDIPVSWEDGMSKVAQILKATNGKILFIGSAYASTESNFALKELAKKTGKANELVFVPHEDTSFGDNFLRKNDRTPNAAACKLLGFKQVSLEDLKAKAHNFDLIYIMEDDAVLEAIGGELTKKTVIAHSTHHTSHSDAVEVIVPAAMHIESEGTYINGKGIPQFVRMAKEIKQMTPEMWMGLSKSRLDKGAVLKDNWRHVENIFDVKASWSLIEEIGKKMGQEFHFKAHKDIFGRLRSEFEIFQNMKISYKIPKESFKNTQFEFAIG